MPSARPVRGATGARDSLDAPVGDPSVPTEPASDVGAEPRRRAGFTTSDASESRPWSLASFAALFVLIAVFMTVDLVADAASGISPTHAAVELSALGVALVGVGRALWQLRRAMGWTQELQRDLRRTRADLEHWRAEAHAVLAHLGTALEHQFHRWELTPAESEIALLILKGLSYKEVANARGTTERTVRHQALAIYRKAGFAGRAEMAAFFLQDLLLPPRREGEGGGTPPPGA
jgi:DNA-binding CsgD family transcriptional regulator